MSDPSPNTERLNRAIERLMSRQPVPLFADDELDDLVELAGRLERELPDDMPDPVFRESLREQLRDPRPRLVRSPQRRGSAWRVPLMAVGGAIAALLVVVVTAGMVASGIFTGSDGSDDGEDSSGTAEFMGANSTVGSFATATATVGSLVVTSPRDDDHVDSTPVPTRVASLNVPPVDAAHIEFGANATAEVAKSADFEEVTYTLDATMPDTPASAQVYRFSVPDVDAMDLLATVSNALQLDSDITIRTVRGKMVFSLKSTNGTTFVWMPASGAFSCTLAGQATVHGDQDEMVAAAYRWLSSSGFPVRDPSDSLAKVTAESGGLRIDYPVETAPDVAMGHPLTVSVLIDAQGTIQSVSGYWLQLVGTQDIGVLSAEEAWDAISSGRGYWMSGSPLEASGQFEVESFSVGYILTTDSDNPHELVLQPVYRATGSFRDYRGHVVEGVSVMVQAITQPTS